MVNVCAGSQLKRVLYRRKLYDFSGYNQDRQGLPKLKEQHRR